ncbi:hypothetical protein ZHAS_00018102 [Anopheles sinensis]|uniref:Uncharacterized protein n=1 Tax=Anopheles sinensis TaxID=74873 RepID=A0A084WIL0_ANOSI|nr:hypothetical protein ZHAS_00018102 [Anopheles sinensis]
MRNMNAGGGGRGGGGGKVGSARTCLVEMLRAAADPNGTPYLSLAIMRTEGFIRNFFIHASRRIPESPPPLIHLLPASPTKVAP